MELTKKNKHVTLDELARMVAIGFNEVKNEINEVKKDVKELRKENAREYEDIKLRLDNVVYRFELEDVEKRVKKLEMKLKIG